MVLLFNSFKKLYTTYIILARFLVLLKLYIQLSKLIFISHPSLVTYMNYYTLVGSLKLS
jgi:hypothetical protein